MSRFDARQSAEAIADVYRFDRFELQRSERRLLASGLPVEIGPKAFDLLLVLLEEAGHLVTKDELLDRVWQRLAVTENSLQVQVSALRKILGPQAISVVSGRGYRLNPAVEKAARDVPARPGGAPLHNLPRQPASFVGRDIAVRDIRQIFDTSRLLTLTGAGGCGKTRLALHAGEQLIDEHADGVWFVELASADGDRVPRTVAGALGIQARPDEDLVTTIVRHLAGRELLLILDNAEHLLDACASLVEHSLSRTDRLKILVTSRKRLGINGEKNYRVPPLSVPDVQRDATPERLIGYESARLFVDRAQSQQPHFSITSENALPLASICRRLDGIPLALELAAARVRSMSIEELDRRLDQRFGLLTQGSRTSLPRHRTLRSLIDWSYDLLVLEERCLFERLSIFSGGCSLEAVEQICADAPEEAVAVLDLLGSLIDKNLIVATERNGTSRYAMLETIRDYARRRLAERGDADRWQGRHLQYFSTLATQSDGEILKTDPAAWLARLEDEHGNLRAALTFASVSDGHASQGLVLAATLWRFWYVHGHDKEGARWLSTFLDAVPMALQPPEVRARALSGAGALAYHARDFALARTHFTASLAVRRQLNDIDGMAGAFLNLGVIAHIQSDWPTAEAMYAEGLTTYRSTGDQRGTATALVKLGEMSRDTGRLEAGRTYSREALAILRVVDAPLGIAEAALVLATSMARPDDSGTAAPLLHEALTTYRQLDDGAGMVAAVEAVGRLCVASLSTAQTGIGLLGAADAVRRKFGWLFSDAQVEAHAKVVADARRAFTDDETFDRLWEEGGSMELDAATDAALEACRR